MREAVSFADVDRADKPQRPTSIEDAQDAVLAQLYWTVKSARSLVIVHRCKADPISARRHLEHSLRGARTAQRARESGVLCIVAAGLAGGVIGTPAEERQRNADLDVVLRTFRDAGARLDLIWEGLRQAFVALAGAQDGRPWVERPRRKRRVLQYRLLQAAERILAHIKRRLRWKAAAAEDAPRRVSRGRAPPLLADCAL